MGESNPFQLEQRAEGRLSLSGTLHIENAAALRETLFRSVRDRHAEVSLDVSGVTYLDGAATAVLLELDRTLRSSGGRLRLADPGDAVSRLLHLFDWEAVASTPPPSGPRRRSLPVQVGENALHLLREARRMCEFTGCLALCGLRSLAAPGRFRWRETFRHLEGAGVDAVPIVALISTLMGLIMAFLGAIQLEPYGAEIYVADMVALAMVRELGPIMTAILVAGRSGSGFAAELGSMVLDDEVDALVTMGFEPVEYLAVPRVGAVVLAMPALAVFSDVAGILGGLGVALVQLDVTLVQYVNETRAILTLEHMAVGLSKSVVFGLLAASVGCYKGLGVHRGAEGVGRAATSSVVTGIFLIVLTDALFAFVLTYLPF